jgi:hypothetical protein
MGELCGVRSSARRRGASLEGARRHSPPRCCRRQRALSPIDQDKADREWLPLVLAAGLQRFAIVLPTSALDAMNLEDRLGKIPGTTLEIAYFKGVEEARTWITL